MTTNRLGRSTDGLLSNPHLVLFGLVNSSAPAVHRKLFKIIPDRKRLHAVARCSLSYYTIFLVITRCPSLRPFSHAAGVTEWEPPLPHCSARHHGTSRRACNDSNLTVMTSDATIDDPDDDP